MYQLPDWVWPAALTLVCALAVWRGRDEERLAAGATVLAWALSLVEFRAGPEATQWEIMFIDMALLGLLVFIALRSGRYWPLFAAAFKLLEVVTHVARALDSSVSAWAYLTAGLIFSYLSLFTIGYAAWTAPRYAAVNAAPTEDPGATRR